LIFLDVDIAAIIAVVSVISIRFLAIKYNWNLPRSKS
jgi:uncharacterized membrane protein YeiH